MTMASIFFLDRVNGLMIGTSPAPDCNVITREEYKTLFFVPAAERPAKLAELRAPKAEDAPAEAPA
jgi:hypothetical protein